MVAADKIQNFLLFFKSDFEIHFRLMIRLERSLGRQIYPSVDAHASITPRFKNAIPQ